MSAPTNEDLHLLALPLEVRQQILADLFSTDNVIKAITSFRLIRGVECCKHIGPLGGPSLETVQQIINTITPGADQVNEQLSEEMCLLRNKLVEKIYWQPGFVGTSFKWQFATRHLVKKPKHVGFKFHEGMEWAAMTEAVGEWRVVVGKAMEEFQAWAKFGESKSKVQQPRFIEGVGWVH